MTVSISSGVPGETCSLDRPRCSEGASQGHNPRSQLPGDSQGINS